MMFGLRKGAPTTDTAAGWLAAGILHRAGLQLIDETAPESIRHAQEKVATVGWKFRDNSLEDLCRLSLELSGHNIPRDRGELIRSAMSTGTLQNAFTSAVGAALMQSYSETDDFSQGLVREVDIKDFRDQERIRMTRGGAMSLLLPGDTAKHAAPADTKESYRIHRFAEQLAIDDQDIINDSLGALLEAAADLGAKARRVRPDLVASILLGNPTMDSDSTELFHADHGNLTEASSALSAATLQAAISAMARQTEAGVTLGIRAATLLVPVDLKFNAMILLQSAERVVASDSGGTLNPLRGEGIALRSDARLGVGGVVDPTSGTSYAGSATNWFLLANPRQAPTIEVGYLQGTGRAPQLRSFVLNRGQYGIGWDCKIDIGAKALDYRGLFKATGAA